MKIRETSPAISTGLASWARGNATAPFSSLRPVAVIMPGTIRSQGVLAWSRLASQSSSASNRTRAGFSLVAWNMTTSRQYLAQLRAYSGLLSKVSISRGACLWTGRAGTTRPDRAWADARSRRNKSGARIRRRSSDVAGSTFGLFLVRYWAISRSSSAEVSVGGETFLAGRCASCFFKLSVPAEVASF